jgi:CMP-N,N'-diacetyllegionaminic acid synthase
MNIAIIPARGGSKRIPRKNVQLLGDKPLVVWSIETALACQEIDDVYVSTDDKTIADISEKAGAKIIWRDELTANDTAGDFEVLRHAIENIPWVLVPDLNFVYLRPTTPFRDPSIVDEAIRKFRDMKSGLLTSLRSVNQMPESAWKCFTMQGPILYPIDDEMTMDDAGTPDQLHEPTYQGNGYVDIVLPATLKEGHAWGNNVYGFITPPVIELDTMEQWEMAELWIERRLKNDKA